MKSLGCPTFSPMACFDNYNQQYKQSCSLIDERKHLPSGPNEENAPDDPDGDPRRRHTVPDQRVAATLRRGRRRLGIRPPEPREGRPVHGDGGRAAVCWVGDGSLRISHMNLDWLL